MNDPLVKVVAALEQRGGPVRRTGDQVDARCPAHDDRNPSLSVRFDRPAGKVLINCHTGCSPDTVVDALGLSWSDLFATQDDDRDRIRRPEVVATYPYVDLDGTVQFEKVRYAPKDFRIRHPAGRGWKWGLGGAKKVLYRLPELRAAIDAGKPVLVVEGEKDADRAVEQLDMTATTNFEGAAKPGQRTKWRSAYTEQLRGARVLIVADRDEPGIAHARAVAAAIRGVAAQVRIVLPAVEDAQADLSDHLDAGYGIEDLVPLDPPQPTVSEPAATAVETPVEPAPMLRLPILPGEFWAARPVLEHIRRAAHARLASADLVLHVILAKLAAMRSHKLVFDSGRGRSSLNYFTGVIGPSGIGKTTGAAAVDEHLLPLPAHLSASDEVAEPFLDGIPLGSGEGIAEAFMGMKEVIVEERANGDPVNKKVRGQVRHNAFVVVDEGEAFTRLGERTGATVAATLRSAWVGATIGQANGRDDTTRIVKAGTYSLGLLVGFQPPTALPLLADTATGTAQRFAWASATDPTLPDEPVEHPGALAVRLVDDTDGFARTPRTGEITFPAEIVAELRRQHVMKVRGELVVDERDSQAPLMRSKMAALLALLDDRLAVTAEDWHLAAIMWQTSAAVRDAVVEHGQQEKARQAELIAQSKVDLAERTAAAVDQVGAKVERLARVLAERVVTAGGMTRGTARKGMRSDERNLFSAVVDRAETLGLIRRDPSGALLPPVVDEAAPVELHAVRGGQVDKVVHPA